MTSLVSNSPASAHSAEASVQDFHVKAIAAANEAAYRWTIGSDKLWWSDNAGKIINRSPEELSSGKRYSSLLDAENLTSRFDVVMHSAERPHPDGVPFRIEYQLKATADSPMLWVEDTGRWFSDTEGRPSEVVGIVRQINDRHAQDQELSYLSRNDSLTGMMNRGRMNDVLAEAICTASEGGTPLAFAVAAINNLNVINDAYGFEIADEVIATVSRRLRAVMRTGDGIARYSGSKFGIILNACTAAELPAALERFLLAVRESVIETECGPVWSLLSVGAVAVPDAASTAAEAMSCAEESLSRALRQPSDCYDIYVRSEEREAQRALNARCATEIIDCLKSGVFHLAFQPMVEAKSGTPIIYEGLLRMKDSVGEVVAAGHLVPVAERLGLVRLIDRAVVQLALEALHRHSDARISINVSATTANDTRWNNQIIDMIAAAAPLHERLIVEITETTALSDLPGALTFFEKLRSLGCCVAIDDFGAGFSSFRNLRDLPVDIIKLDGSYCRNLSENAENAYFVRMLIDLAHQFGIKTVAEWVESEADAKILREYGVDYLQGNLYGAAELNPPWTEATKAEFDFDSKPENVVDGAAMPDDATLPSAETLTDAAPVVSADTVNFEDASSPADAPRLEFDAVAPQVVLLEPVVQPFVDAIEVTSEIAIVQEASDDTFVVAEEADSIEVETMEIAAFESDEQIFQEAELSINSLKNMLDELSKHFRPAQPEEQRLAS